MKMKLKRVALAVSILLLLVFAFGLGTDASLAADKQGMYEFVLEKSSLSFEKACERLHQAIDTSAVQGVAEVDEASPEGCTYRVRVFAIVLPDLTEELLRANGVTAPFALVQRITVFEDENGTNVSFVNPRSVFRTVLLDAPEAEKQGARAAAELRSFLQAVFPEHNSHRQYGPFRKKGYIGRTMGVMAGGPFDGKIVTVARAQTGNMQDLIGRLRRAFEKNAGKWQLRVRYVYEVPERGLAVLGVSGAKMESKSFSIVKAGSDKLRKKLRCPGIGHAGAYPIELVLRKEGNHWLIQTVQTMYRMKMYFEDAGKFAFAKNMTMPGSIQSEIEQVVRGALQK